MPTIRQQRVTELLFEELSILIGNELADPKLSLVRVTNVTVSRDLRNVNVYVTHDDDELSKRDVLQGLRRATPFLRRQLAVRGSFRAVPELAFHYDDTPEKAARVDALLREIAASRTDDTTGNSDTPGNNGTGDTQGSDNQVGDTGSSAESNSAAKP